MSEEAILEDYFSESDEAEDWESDEAFGESDESVEDIGEARRRRRRKVNGVRGMKMRGPNGTSNLKFPAKLATAASTNLGLARQAADTSNLKKRLDLLEGKLKSAASVPAYVNLAFLVGFSGHGAFQASKLTTGSALEKYASTSSAKLALIASGTQLLTSGAQLVTGQSYPPSRISLVADIAAAVQISAFAFGSFSSSSAPRSGGANLEALRKLSVKSGETYLTDDGKLYEVIDLMDGKLGFRDITR